MQGYNAQAVTNEQQIVIAAEISADSPDFGPLAPMVGAAKDELERAGLTDTPGVVVADAGYWHQAQLENVISQGTPVLIAPDAPETKGRPAGLRRRRLMRSCAASWKPTSAAGSTENARR